MSPSSVGPANMDGVEAVQTDGVEAAPRPTLCDLPDELLSAVIECASIHALRSTLTTSRRISSCTSARLSSTITCAACGTPAVFVEDLHCQSADESCAS